MNNYYVDATLLQRYCTLRTFYAGATLAQGALRITVAIRNARTGGAAGAIDRWLLGNNHIYDSATAKVRSSCGIVVQWDPQCRHP